MKTYWIILSIFFFSFGFVQDAQAFVKTGNTSKEILIHTSKEKTTFLERVLVRKLAKYQQKQLKNKGKKKKKTKRTEPTLPMSIVAAAMGLVALMAIFLTITYESFFFALLFTAASITAFILGLIALLRLVKDKERKGKGLSIFAIVTGGFVVLGIAIYALVGLGALIFFI